MPQNVKAMSERGCTWCMMRCSKEVERELPMWSSRRPGKVASRYAFLRSDPQVVNTCHHIHRFTPRPG